MTTVRSFNDEVKALEEYGHDCCARIDDRIHECCKRISEAHENEVAAVDIALRLKELQDFGYDALGNERHKTALALKDCEFTYTKTEDNLEVLLVDGFGIRGSACYLEAFERLRDRLIYLLVGDQNPVKFSELFGILKEDSDGVDAGPSDSASADSPVHGTAGCGCGVACGCDGEELLAPITQELRDGAERYCNFKNDNIVKFNEEDFDCLCDAIDAIHAQLEHDVEMWRDRAEDMRMERDDALKEHHAWAPESHYVMLPKDSAGEPVHVGDVMAYKDNTKPMEVVALVPPAVFLTEDGPRYADMCRHYHTPTVEDVLREMLYKAHIYDKREMELLPDLIAEYAAKLCLSDANA